MFDALTEDLLNELELRLIPSLKAGSDTALWQAHHVVAALHSCQQDVVDALSQSSDMFERQRWCKVYLGIESMVTVMDWLNTGLPPRPSDLQF